MTHVLRCLTDFAVRTDTKGKEVLETDKSNVLMPAMRWNEEGIKWFDDTRLVKEAKC